MGFLTRLRRPTPKPNPETKPDWHYMKARFEYDGYDTKEFHFVRTYLRTDLVSGRREKVLILSNMVHSQIRYPNTGYQKGFKPYPDAYSIGELGEFIPHIDAEDYPKFDPHRPYQNRNEKICYWRIVVIKDSVVDEKRTAIELKERQEAYRAARKQAIEIWSQVHREMDQLFGE